jgi:hypothetical protein
MRVEMADFRPFGLHPGVKFFQFNRHRLPLCEVRAVCRGF